jgi:hypothetical protein
VSSLRHVAVAVLALVMLGVGLWAATRTAPTSVRPGRHGHPPTSSTPSEEGRAEANELDQPHAARSVCAHPYLPLGEGASWSYRLSGPEGQGAVVSILRVVAVRDAGTQLEARIEARRLSQVDVSTIRCGDNQADEPWQLALVPYSERFRPFPLPRDPGALESSMATFERPSFVRRGETETVRVTRRTATLGEETVTVPGGTFVATHLSHEEATPTPVLPGGAAGGESVSRVDDWLAEGVGLVRRAMLDAEGNVIAEQVLVEFVPP